MVTEGKLRGSAAEGDGSEDFVEAGVFLVTTLAGIALLALEHRLFPAY
jgi:hypothetical protein